MSMLKAAGSPRLLLLGAMGLGAVAFAVRKIIRASRSFDGGRFSLSKRAEKLLKHGSMPDYIWEHIQRLGDFYDKTKQPVIYECFFKKKCSRAAQTMQ
jgi:hypothetical protein